ncbi:hypothetical protein JVU11DRAFT_10401 [Chiua virens]|nr:hypothetical protein JVU11DRAFT_10401 [Chiua virens]
MNIAPPSQEHPHGLYDSAIFSTHAKSDWPSSGLNGHVVVQLRIVFRMLGTDEFLTYVQCFNGYSTNPWAYTDIMQQVSMLSSVQQESMEIGLVMSSQYPISVLLFIWFYILEKCKFSPHQAHQSQAIK